LNRGELALLGGGAVHPCSARERCVANRADGERLPAARECNAGALTCVCAHHVGGRTQAFALLPASVTARKHKYGTDATVVTRRADCEHATVCA